MDKRPCVREVARAELSCPVDSPRKPTTAHEQRVGAPALAGSGSQATPSKGRRKHGRTKGMPHL